MASNTTEKSHEILDELPEELKVKLKEYHCCNCGRFLALYAIVEGTIAIKCRKCKELNVLDIQAVETEGGH